MANSDLRKMRKGPWVEEEDEILTTIVKALGEKHWDALAKQSGLRRSGKSCRLRWMNYLRPNLKHGEITQEEEAIILDLYKQWGTKWSKIAKRMPGRTDNEIKNYWRTHLKKKSEAQQAAGCFEGTKSHTEQDLALPTRDTSCDHIGIKSSMSGNDGTFGISSSDRVPDMCNMNAMGNNSPYESRISEWISSCSWPNEVKYNEDCMGTYMYPGFCQLGSSSEENKNHSVLDLWNPIWEMG